ncbi:MAG: hypothetical protein ACRC8S_16230 [Fimbriiglobus sp.]
MDQVPQDLLAVLPPGAEPVAERWWTSLTEADRQRIAGLWDERLEVRFFAPQPDAECEVDRWEQVPVVRGGRFVPPDDDGRAEWSPGYFEHLLQHPELLLAYEAPFRVFYICTQHPAAKECLKAGRVPVDFVCPLADAGCPLLALRGANLAARR